VRAVAAALRKMGLRDMIVWVLRDNAPAREFYERLGGSYVRAQPITIGTTTLEECRMDGAISTRSILSRLSAPGRGLRASSSRYQHCARPSRQTAAMAKNAKVGLSEIERLRPARDDLDQRLHGLKTPACGPGDPARRSGSPQR